jgi:hypothetical protein
MRFAGFADGEPQSTGTTDSGSGFCAIEFKFSAVEFKFWSTNTTTTPPVLLFSETGTDSDVAAVASVLNRLKLSYATANSSQLNAMTETRLKAHKLFIVPGGIDHDRGQSFRSNDALNSKHSARGTPHGLKRAPAMRLRLPKRCKSLHFSVFQLPCPFDH